MFLLFLGVVLYDNEFETKENKIWTKDKIEPQHICTKNHMQLQIKKIVHVKKSHVHAEAWDICHIRCVWVRPFVFLLLAVYHFKE